VAAVAAASGSATSTTGTAIGVPSTLTAATRTPAVANTVLATPSVGLAGAMPYAQTVSGIIYCRERGLNKSLEAHKN